MDLFPGGTGIVMALQEMVFSLGYTLGTCFENKAYFLILIEIEIITCAGPALGSFLYIEGGFEVGGRKISK